MKATPIAEFLTRKTAAEAPAPRTAPHPFVPRRTANDDSEPDFRRSGLGAAFARRTDAPALVRPLDAAALPPRRDPASAPRPAAAPTPPAVDWETQLSEAYHRGVQEGLDAGKAEAVTARAMERAELQKRAVIEKLDFQMNEFARLSESLASGLAELERRIAEAAARALKPLLLESVSRRIVEELVENVARLTRAGGVGLLKARGPERLLSAFKHKVEALAVDVEYVEEDGVEITVSAQATEIRSELGAWTRLIEDVVENG